MENPYQSHASDPPTDTKFCRSVLEIYKKYQGRDMPLADLLGMHLKSWIIVALMFSGLILFWTWAGRNGDFSSGPIAGIVVGMFFGLILRDIRYCRTSARIWPIVNDVLNWERVDQKLEELGPK